MSTSRILQVLIIVNNALADAMVGDIKREKVGGVLDILGMLEHTLASERTGGEGNG